MEVDVEALPPEIAAAIVRFRMEEQVDQKEVFAANKAALGHFMRRHGIDRVMANYEGCGDSGGVDEVLFFQGETVIEHFAESRETICLISVVCNYNFNEKKDEAELIKLRPRDAFAHMVEEALGLSGHDGWQIEEGGYGDVTFALSEEGLDVYITHNEFYREVKRHDHQL